MDIVLVTHNSSKWIQGCLDSIAASKVNAESLHIYIVDNRSTDDTLKKLEQYKSKNCFGSFIIVVQEYNLGFGNANNAGAFIGADEIIFFINIDTQVYPNTFELLQKEIENSEENVGVWEMRQVPYEHPKIYNPITRETSWVSGAAFAVRRKIFEQVKGFDANIFMYAEDVDISWRIRALGYKLKYCPEIKIIHYTYQNENEVKPVQYLESIKNNILLKYRYGSVWIALGGLIKFWEVYLFYKEPFMGAKKELLKMHKELKLLIPQFKKTKVSNKNICKFVGWDYEENRDGAFVRTDNIRYEPLVSIIVRTCQRPSVLRETLISLKNQTYSNFEVLVIEDGAPSAKYMIETEFGDMNIRYYATNSKKGRSIVGNLGMELSKGVYLNFLDDDDCFYADHIETLVSALNKTNKKAVYSFAFETPVKVYSEEPYNYEIVTYNKRYHQQFDKVELCHHNYIPIQCIMFSRELYEKLGGFDTSLDYLEDWDLWVRYMQETDYECVPKTTSIYKVPADKQTQKERQKKLDEAVQAVRKKYEFYYIKIPVSSLVSMSQEKIYQKILKRIGFRKANNKNGKRI